MLRPTIPWSSYGLAASRVLVTHLTRKSLSWSSFRTGRYTGSYLIKFWGCIDSLARCLKAEFLKKAIRRPCSLLQDEEKKQPAVMLRSSWAFKNSPFFAPEDKNRPLRYLVNQWLDTMFVLCLRRCNDPVHWMLWQMYFMDTWSHDVSHSVIHSLFAFRRHILTFWRWPNVTSNNFSGGVCSFEIYLDEIAGLDYWNPLLVDASRVVIEAKGSKGSNGDVVIKSLCFLTRKDV